MVSKKDEYFLNKARIAAQQSDMVHFKIGACFHKKKKTSYSGYAHQRNKHKNYFLSSIHAEMHALKQYFLTSLSDRTREKRYECVYVVRLSNTSVYGNAKPCSICVLMLQSVNIKYCCYSTGNPDKPFEKVRIRDLELDHLSAAQEKYITSQTVKYHYNEWF